MASSSTYRQLVLCDCDDGRLSLFKNHDKYLSQIPSNCECFIFWNDLKLPVYKKLKWILRQYSHIHFCPSYSEQMSASCSSDLLFYLDKLICKFSSVLIVHGNDQSYENVFERVTKQYGTVKIGLEAIDKPFSQHLPHIINRFRKKNRQHSHHEYLKSLPLKDQLKHKRQSFFSNSIWKYDNNSLPYELEENASFKSIIKRKQKNLKIYFYNSRLYGTKQFSAEFNANDQYEQDDDYLPTMSEQTQNSGLEIDLSEISPLMLQYRKGLKHTFAIKRHFDGTSVGFIPLSIIQSSNRVEYRKPMIKEKGPKKTKSAIGCKIQTKITPTDTSASNLHKSRKVVKQKHVQKVEVKHNSESKPSSCPQCTKTFRCINDVTKHFNAKHVQPTSYYTTNQTCSIDKQTTVMQEKKNTTENASFVINKSFYRSQLLENVKSITRSGTDPTVEHAESIISTYAKSSCRNDTSSMVVQEQTKIKQHTTNSTKTIFSCWQYSKKFETTFNRLNHFNEIHSASFLPSTNVSSSHLGDHLTPVLEQIHSSNASINCLSKSHSVWEYAKKSKSDDGLISHSIEKHAKTVLPIDADRSSVLRKHTAMVQERMKVIKPSFSCSQCSKTFKATDDLDRHSIAKHGLPILSTTPKPPILSTTTKSPVVSTTTKSPIVSTAIKPPILSTTTKPPVVSTTTKPPSHSTTTKSPILSTTTKPPIVSTTIKPPILSTTIKPPILSTTTKPPVVSTRTKPPSHSTTTKSPIVSTTIKPPILSHNQTEMIQAHMTRAELTNNLINKSISCSQCTKKFRFTADVKQHFDAKHAQSISTTTTNQTSSTIEQTTFMQKKKTTKDYATNLTQNLFSCSKCSEKFESTTSRDIHFSANHTESYVSATTILLSPPTHKTTTLSNQTKSTKHTTNYADISFQCSRCTDLFGSATAYDIHINAKHTESNVSTNIKLLSDLDSRSTMMKDQTKATVHMNDPVKTFFCWKCSKKFHTTSGRLEHFINTHATSVRSKIIELSTLASNRIAAVQDQISSEKTTNNSRKTPFGCWECTKKLESDVRLIVHFVRKHASFILTTNSDPSGTLESQIAMAQERLATAQKRAIPMVVSYNCSQCSKKFKSADARISHCNAKHVESSLSTITPLLKHPNRTTTTIEHQKKVTKHTMNSITFLSQRPLCPETFEVAASVGIYLDAKKTGSGFTTNAEPANSSNSQSTMTKDQTNITKHKSRSTKLFSCWKCSTKFETTRSRLEHFIRNHSTSFLPTDNVLSSHLGDQTIPIGEQMDGDNVSINCLSESHSCWECEKKFKSHNDHISHFIDQHARGILVTDTDPSSVLKNQIAIAQKWLKATKEVSFNCLYCVNKFKSIAARINHCNTKHAGLTLCTGSKLSNLLDNQTTAPQKQLKIVENTDHPLDTSFNNSEYSKEFISVADYLDHSNAEHMKRTSSTTTIIPSRYVESETEVSRKHVESLEPERNFIDTPYYCQRCQKEFTCTSEHLAHFRMEHTEVKSFITTAQDFFTDPGVMKCPRAKFPTLVYLSLGPVREQIRIVPGKTNRCPHEACKSRIVNYEFEELYSHTITEHKDAQLRLECCDPRITYTLEEYKRHLLYCDKNYETLWHLTSPH